MKKFIGICILAATIVSCNNQAKQEAAVAQAKQVILDSVTKVNDAKKAEEVRKNVVDSMNNVRVEKKQHENVIVHKTLSDGTGVTQTTNTTTTTTETKQKKGWSNKAKGAVIGAGVGAITGAMIDKKKGEGAVVGGIIGAGAGLGVGAIIDGKKTKPKE